MTILHAKRIAKLRDGGAFWYCRAETANGPMFVKMPFAQIMGGHESAWQEFIALQLALEIGIPALQPHRVSIPSRMLTVQDRARTFWGNGDHFCGTAFQQLSRACNYDILRPNVKSLLFVFDNFLSYGDRTEDRVDVFVDASRQVRVLDWDFYPCPSRLGSGIPVERITWSASLFLRRGLKRSMIESACQIVSNLTDSSIYSIVSRAGAVWSIDNQLVTAWLLGRRNHLQQTLQAAD